jgi:hypothetical protein
MPTIPASYDVTINPQTLAAGGSALAMNGLMLSDSNRIPTGSILSFPLAASVASYFGSTSAEAIAAGVYFNGFEGSTVKPAALLMTQYNKVAVSGFLRGGNISGLTLAQLQALTGTVIISVAGTQFTSSTINLSGATSFSNAATIIQAAFTAPTFAVTYDAISGGFLFTTTATGATATITAATGTLSAGLLLTIATGAVLSQGAAARTPTEFMAATVASSQNWVSFMTLADPDASGNANKLLFSAWANSTNNRYGYVCWDTDATPKASNNATTSMGQILKGLASSGTLLVSAPDYLKAAFACGIAASVDYAATNGKASFKYKSQSGLTADVTDATTAANLTANGYNFYGAFATANQGFVYFSEGSISGKYLWADAYFNEIWLNANFQLSALTYLTSIKSVPYDTNGYAALGTALQSPIDQGLNFGLWGMGNVLSSSQIASVNAAAGKAIDMTLAANGSYLQIVPATALQRQSRLSPSINFWYIDNGAIHKLTINSIAVQ